VSIIVHRHTHIYIASLKVLTREMSGKIMSILNSPLVTMGLVFGCIQLTRFIDMTSAKSIMALRIGYLVSQMLLLVFWTWMRSLVKRAGGKKGQPEMVEVDEASKPLSGEAPRKIHMTVAEYDSQEVGKQMQQVIIGTIFLMVLHWYFGMVHPLFLQLILPWKSVVTNPLVRIHLFGSKAEGALKRPFKQPSPFSEFMGEQTAAAGEETKEGNGEGRTQEVTSDNEGISSAGSEGEDTGSKTRKAEPKLVPASRKKAGRKED